MGAFKSQNLISVGKAGALNVTMFIVPKIALAHSHLQCTLKQFTLYQLPLLLVTLVLRSSVTSLHSAKGARSRHRKLLGCCVALGLTRLSGMSAI